MRKIILILMCLMAFYISKAQITPLTKAEFSESINKTFANIITGDEKNSIGTFASLDTKDAAATLNVSRITESCKVFSMNVKASVSDGISSIFSNSKLNSDIAIQFKYSSLKTDGSALTFYTDPATSKRVMTGYKFGWVNVFYTVNSQAFRLFDPSASFSDQVKKNNYVAHKLGFEYNYINWATDDPKNLFFSVGAYAEVNNNLSDLTKIELTDVANYTTTAGQRTSTKKYFVYTGKYAENLSGAAIYSDFYRFLFDFGHSAIHLFPKVQFAKKDKPAYSFGFGLLVGLKNKKDNTIINTELFANFMDLTNTSASEKKLLERNNIGLRFAFPINFNH
jgi:hypothetical protein